MDLDWRNPMRTIFFALAFLLGFLVIAMLNPILFTLPEQQLLSLCIFSLLLGIASDRTMGSLQ
jgi:hypothetical protein